MARKPTDIINLKLRLSEALRRRLERAAERGDRSMNSEIVHRLEQSFEPPPFDLFSALQSAIEDARRRHGDDKAELLRAVGIPIRAALEQILPDLHSVELALMSEAGDEADMRYRAFSDAGWKADGSKS